MMMRNLIFNYFSPNRRVSTFIPEFISTRTTVPGLPFFRSMINAKNDIQDYENKFGKSIALNGIREKIEEIYEFCRANKKEELKKIFAKDPTTEEDFK